MLMIQYDKKTNTPYDRNEKSNYKVIVDGNVWDNMVRKLYGDRLHNLDRFIDEKLIVTKLSEIKKEVKKDGVFKKEYNFKMNGVGCEPYDYHLEFEITQDGMKVKCSSVGVYKSEYTIECDIVYMNEYELGELRNVTGSMKDTKL